MPLRMPSFFENSARRFRKKYEVLWGLALATSFVGIAGGCSTDNWKPFDGRIIDAAGGTDRGSMLDVSADVPSTDVPSIPDAPSTDDTSGDATLLDATPIDGADVACACVLVDAPIPLLIGELPMPCYCAKTDWHDNFDARPNCPSFDEAVTCRDAGLRYGITRYTNCNLITVNYDVSNADDSRVYDATTHELVGAVRATDFVVSSCGERSVHMIRSGVTPGVECEIAGWVRPCDPGDAGSDAKGEEEGGACSCTLDDQMPPFGHVPLACHCAAPKKCPAYLEAVAGCPAPPDAWKVIIEEYATCNRTVVRYAYPSAFDTFIYDYTTHDLVGATSAARDFTSCGDGGANVIHAGDTTVACPMTRTFERCPSDGG